MWLPRTHRNITELQQQQHSCLYAAFYRAWYLLIHCELTNVFHFYCINGFVSSQMLMYFVQMHARQDKNTTGSFEDPLKWIAWKGGRAITFHLQQSHYGKCGPNFERQNFPFNDLGGWGGVILQCVCLVSKAMQQSMCWILWASFKSLCSRCIWRKLNSQWHNSRTQMSTCFICIHTACKIPRSRAQASWERRPVSSQPEQGENVQPHTHTHTSIFDRLQK